MKRLLSVLMVVCVISALSGCSEKTSVAPQVGEESNSVQSPVDQKVSETSPIPKDGVKKFEFEEIVPEVPTKDGYIFSNGMGTFNYNGKRGYIGEDGKVIIEPKYRYAMPFNENYAIVTKRDAELFIIDKQGNEIELSDEYYYDQNYYKRCYKFVNGVAFVRIPNHKTTDRKGALVAIDTTGKEVFRLNGGYGFSGMVKGNYMIGSQIYDKSWNKVSEFAFGDITNTNGIIDPIDLVNFEDGLIIKKEVVDGSSLYGIIDTEGKTVVDFKFENLKVSAEGMVAFKKYGKWGFIDYTGKVVIEPTYDEAYTFYNGLCPVKVDNKIGFIDKQNKMVIPPTYDPKYVNGKSYFKFSDHGVALVSQVPAVFIDRTGQSASLDGVISSYNDQGFISMYISDAKTRLYKLKM